MNDNDNYTLNLLGALALGLVDVLNKVVEVHTGHGGGAPAALVTLGAEPGISINNLRKALNLSHPGTVRLIDRLEADGLVERSSGRDNRTLALFLTEAGHERRKVILAERRRQLHLIYENLTPTERKQLTKLLEKMLTTLTTDERRAYVICRLCEVEICFDNCCPVEQRYQELVKESEVH